MSLVGAWSNPMKPEGYMIDLVTPRPKLSPRNILAWNMWIMYFVNTYIYMENIFKDCWYLINTRYIAVLYITWRVIKLEKCQSPRNHKRCDIPDEVKALWDVAGTCQFLHQIWHLRGLHNMDALKGNINWFYSIQW